MSSFSYTHSEHKYDTTRQTRTHARYVAAQHDPGPVGGWFKVENEILNCKVSGYAKLVYVALKRHSNGYGSCRVSHETLAKECGWHKNTVKRAVRELTRAGLLTVDSQKKAGRANHYQPAVPAGEGSSHRATPSSVRATGSSHRATEEELLKKNVEKEKDAVFSQKRAEGRAHSPTPPRKGRAHSPTPLEGQTVIVNNERCEIFATHSHGGRLLFAEAQTEKGKVYTLYPHELARLLPPQPGGNGRVWHH